MTEAQPADTTPAAKPSAIDSLFGDERPPWLHVHMQKLDDPAVGDGLELTAEELAAAPPKIQRALAKMVRAADTGKAGLSELQAKLKADREAVEAQKREAMGLEANALDVFKHQLLKEFRESLRPKGAKADPASPEGMEQFLDERLAKRLDAFFETFDKIGAERAAAATKAAADAAYNARIAEMDAWFDATPDMADPRIYDLVKAEMQRYGQDPDEPRLFRMRAEDAYEIVMNRLALEADKAELDAARARARERVKPGGNHGRGPATLPQDFAKMSPEQKGEWLARNKEARDAFLGEQRRKGNLAT